MVHAPPQQRRISWSGINKANTNETDPGFWNGFFRTMISLP